MAKLFKITAYIVDPADEFYDASSLKDCLVYCTQNDINLSHLKITEADLGEWDDDHPLNYIDCPEVTFKKYLKEP